MVKGAVLHVFDCAMLFPTFLVFPKSFPHDGVDLMILKITVMMVMVMVVIIIMMILVTLPTSVTHNKQRRRRMQRLIEASTNDDLFECVGSLSVSKYNYNVTRSWSGTVRNNNMYVCMCAYVCMCIRK